MAKMCIEMRAQHRHTSAQMGVPKFECACVFTHMDIYPLTPNNFKLQTEAICINKLIRMPNEKMLARICFDSIISHKAAPDMPMLVELLSIYPNWPDCQSWARF